MLASLLASVAIAGPTVESGWSTYRAGDYARAARLAATAIEDAPTSIAWHRLYSRARARVDGDRAVIQQYRHWHEAAPTDPVRRVLLADALAGSWRFDPSWCAEIEPLLAVTPGDAEARFWTHAVRHHVRTRRCKADAAEDARAVVELADAIEGGPGAALPIAMADGIDAADADRIRRALAAEPALLGRMEPVFEASGKGTKRARRAVLTAAREVVAAGDDAPYDALHDAFVMLKAADAPERAEAEARLAASARDSHGYGVARTIHLARRHADPMRALAQVDALEPGLPDDPEILAVFHTARGDLLRKAGDVDRARDAYRAAWEATPEHPDRANFFAYNATLTGRDLEAALVAATTAVEGFRSARFSDRAWAGETFDEWRESSAQRVGEALDTRGWALHLMGRDAEAVPDLLQASRLVDVPVVELHVGLVLAALGENDAAAPHLARGTTERNPAEQTVVNAGWDALRAWWNEAGIWHPGGLEGWVADMNGEKPEARQVSDPSGLIGKPLPSVSVLLDGESVALADVEGPAVIDVWATWCRPCVEALPEVERLAGEYPSVRFLAISVDDKAAAVDAFFDGTTRPAVPIGWWSSSDSPYELLGIAGVPSLFVVDDQNRVAAYVFGADVNRLGAAVEAVASEH